MVENPNLRILALADGGSLDSANQTIDLDSYAFGSIQDYFDKKSLYYQDFTSRLQVASYFELQKFETYVMSNGEELDQTLFKGNTVLMCICDTLRYRLYNSYCNQSETTVHVSKEGAVMMPYFHNFSPFIREEDARMFDLV